MGHDSEKEASNETVEAYQRYVDEFRHEDQLINNRMTWLLTAQGLLFAAYAVLRTKEKAEVGLEFDLEKAVIAGLGVAIGVAVLVSVFAAWLALRLWGKEMEGLFISTCHFFPQFRRARWPIGLGHVSTHSLPLIFVVAWIVMLGRACGRAWFVAALASFLYVVIVLAVQRRIGSRK